MKNQTIKHCNGINNSLLHKVKLSEPLGGVLLRFLNVLAQGKVLTKQFLIVRIRGMWGWFGECAARGMSENHRMKERRGSQVSAKTLEKLSHHTPTHEHHFTVNLKGSAKTTKSFTETLMGGSINSMWCRFKSVCAIWWDCPIRLVCSQYGAP